jgi:hypothetical protein
MYYYLRVIACMFMEREVVAATPTTVTPVPTSNKRVSAKLEGTGSPASRRASTAVAVKPTAAAAVASPAKTAVAVVDEGQWVSLNWMSWAAIWIAAAGTFAMGTVLAFWSVQWAQLAAQMMFR